MLSNHFILCRPLLLLPSLFPSIIVFSSESALCIRWPKYIHIHIFPSFSAVKKSKNVRKSRNKQMKPRGLDNSHQIWALSLQVLKWHCNDKVELPLCKVVKWSWLSLFLVSDTFLSFPPLFPSPVSAHHSCFSFPWDPRTSTKIAKTTVCMAPADDCPMPGPGPPHSLTCQETCKFVATWC